MMLDFGGGDGSDQEQREPIRRIINERNRVAYPRGEMEMHVPLNLAPNQAKDDSTTSGLR
jgi:hypothetical protein